MDRNQIIDNWAEIVLESYGDSSQEITVQTQQETNAEWCACFMTDFEIKRILARAA